MNTYSCETWFKCYFVYEAKWPLCNLSGRIDNSFHFVCTVHTTNQVFIIFHCTCLWDWGYVLVTLLYPAHSVLALNEQNSEWMTAWMSERTNEWMNRRIEFSLSLCFLISHIESSESFLTCLLPALTMDILYEKGQEMFLSGKFGKHWSKLLSQFI